MEASTRNFNRISPNAVLPVSDFRITVILIFVVLNLAIFFIRAISVWHFGALISSGSAASVIYPVWKSVHHLPIYEWPFAYPFSLTMYNYLFYLTYSLFLKIIRVTGDGIPTWGSLFTPMFVIIGAVAQWKLVQTYLNLRGIRNALSLCFALGLWSCSSIIRMYAFAIRPDMAAVAFVMVGLWMVVLRFRFSFACAGASFYLAWSFKQSTVLTFLGVCLFLLLNKQWRDLSVLIIVFAALVTATILLGTPEYRYSILVVPRIMSVFNLRHFLDIIPKSLLANAYWLLVPIVLLLEAGARRIDNVIRMLITTFVIALVIGLFGMTRVGAWDHYLLEAFASGTTLLQIAVFTTPNRLVSMLLGFGCILPAIQIATVPSGAYLHKFGTVEIATANEYAEAVALRDRLALMKKPIFTNDDIFALPWISNDNHAPALVIDRIYHATSWASCQNGCIEGMMQRGEIPTVMLTSLDNKKQNDLFFGYDESYQNNLHPYYEKVGEAHEAGTLWNIYALKSSTQNSR
jgi:hypothetical protein